MFEYLEVPLNCESWVDEECLIIVSVVDEVVAKLNLGILNVAEIEMEQPIECDDNVMAQDIAALAIQESGIDKFQKADFKCQMVEEAQALYALDHHEPYYFNDEQTQQILESNRQFQQLNPAEQYFNDCFEPAASESDGKYLTSSAIFAHITKIAGSDLRLNSLNHFGRTLSNIPNLQRKRTTKGTEYLVKLRK